MPVTTYTENPTYSGLQATVQEYLDDETTTVRIPDFIRQFEVKARRALRTSDATATSVGATDANGQVTLPTDFRGVRRASVGGKSLNFITPEDAMERNATQSDRHPDAYLYGALAEAEAYGFDDPRLAMWKALANDALGQIIGADQGTEWASAATVPCDPVF
jgi:hypothetical protein